MMGVERVPELLIDSEHICQKEDLALLSCRKFAEPGTHRFTLGLPLSSTEPGTKFPGELAVAGLPLEGVCSSQQQ